jgi:hypothetical protein
MKKKNFYELFLCFSNKKIEIENIPIVIKKWRIWKNLLVICLAWVLLFTAFQGNFYFIIDFNIKLK